ncbi:MAG: hypothetical protein ACF8NJ_00355, partial [Phycisphaerales bacterium JB038]
RDDDRLQDHLQLAGPHCPELDPLRFDLTRELLVTAVRGQIESQGIKFGAVRAGKLKMILQTIVIPVVLLLVAFADLSEADWATLTRAGLVWATIVVTVLSGIPYITNARRALRERHT